MTTASAEEAKGKGGESVERAVYNAKEIKDLLDINLVKTYELFQQPGFPAVRIGRRIVVPKAAFHKWLEEAAGKELGA